VAPEQAARRARQPATAAAPAEPLERPAVQLAQRVAPAVERARRLAAAAAPAEPLERPAVQLAQRVAPAARRAAA
jgi:hypothetical protein